MPPQSRRRILRHDRGLAAHIDAHLAWARTRTALSGQVCPDAFTGVPHRAGFAPVACARGSGLCAEGFTSRIRGMGGRPRHRTDEGAGVSDADGGKPVTVWLGNNQAVQVTQAGDSPGERVPLPGDRCTTVVASAAANHSEVLRSITDPSGVWAAHSDAPAPTWVASTAPVLAQLLADHYGCPIRDPEELT